MDHKTDFTIMIKRSCPILKTISHMNKKHFIWFSPAAFLSDINFGCLLARSLSILSLSPPFLPSLNLLLVPIRFSILFFSLPHSLCLIKSVCLNLPPSPQSVFTQAPKLSCWIVSFCPFLPPNLPTSSLPPSPSLPSSPLLTSPSSRPIYPVCWSI